MFGQMVNGNKASQKNYHEIDTQTYRESMSPQLKAEMHNIRGYASNREL